VTVVVLVILTVIERQPLASIGLRRPGWGALGFGLLGLVGLLIAQPIGALLQQAAHGRPSPSVFRDMGNLPLWLLVLLPFRAAITEEILFRGYAMTRVESLTRSRVLAFLIPGVLFCLAHVPTFGLTYALAVAPLAVVLGALFLWKRNLWANMIAHAGVDALALAAAWAFAHGLFKVPGA
jgi:membrane protease YdiL (CAAX protease family)